MYFAAVDLKKYFNNVGFTYPEVVGDFTGFGSSYPGDQFPCQADERVEVHGTPFFLHIGKGLTNNIEFASQRIEVSPEKYSGLAVLGSSDNGSFSEYIKLYYRGVWVDQYKLGLSNWVSASPSFNEQAAYRCSGLCAGHQVIDTVNPVMWLQSVRFQRPLIFDEIHLPDNMCMHIFSLTLKGADDHV